MAEVVKVAGCVVLIASLVWVFCRAASDETLVAFRHSRGHEDGSRNPIYVGTLGMVAGLFLIFPSAATLLILVASYMLTQIQIRLEEAYLGRHHGEAYLLYKRKVRRLL